MKLKDYVIKKVNSNNKSINLQLLKRKMKKDGVSDFDILNLPIKIEEKKK